jgi:cytoskeleton-associated protein 5
MPRARDEIEGFYFLLTVYSLNTCKLDSSSLLQHPHMDGPPPQEEDFTSLPISERLAHKNWKARVSAYESLIKTFQTTASDTDPAFKPYINNIELIKKFATDSNAVAQEKGVECLVALIKYAGETAAKTRDGVMPALVEKCLGSTRAGTKSQATELVLQYVEVENGGSGVVVRWLGVLGF